MTALIEVTEAELLAVAGRGKGNGKIPGNGKGNGHGSTTTISLQTGNAYSIPIVDSNANTGIQADSGNLTIFMPGFHGTL